MDQLQFAVFEESKRKTYFVQIILPLPLNTTYTYRVPVDLEKCLAVGKRAIVNFGKRHIYTGIIESIHHNPPKDFVAKYLIDIPDQNEPCVDEAQINFWKWISNYYMCTLGEVMDAAIPANLKLKSETVITLNAGYSPDNELEISDKEYLIIEALELQPELSIDEITAILNIKTVLPVIRDLQKKGIILLKEEMTHRYKPKFKKIVKLNSQYHSNELLSSVFEVLESKAQSKQQSNLLSLYLTLAPNYKEVDKSQLIQQFEGGSSPLKSLINKGILLEEKVEIDRLPSFDKLKEVEITLNEHQELALQQIEESFKNHLVSLLHGVTGSGKTHIYISLIQKQIALGKRALYLLPEIALTQQLISRLQVSFGSKIGIYHSKMGNNERVEMWHKVQQGWFDVVLGVRSSIFLPMKNVGLIVIDEEHEPSYKQHEPAPRYHARDAAIWYAFEHKAKVLLGSATPSFESYYNSKEGKYGLIELNKRHGNVLPPTIELINLKEQLNQSKKNVFISITLQQHIAAALAKREQVILFQNRRGYAPVIECKKCNWIPSCKNCDISLTYHKFNHSLSCHYCGYRISIPSACPSCSSHELAMKGLGTERLEDDLEIIFPDKHITRMDLDTTRKKYSIEEIFNDIKAGKTDILVGTQMVTKGLDFEKVRLVGIISADSLLHYPDFRAVERAFQLMLQVAGRAGRREKRGKVMIQTYHPEHQIFELLIRNDYKGLYFVEMQQRQAFSYPPYTRLIKIIFRHRDDDKTKEAGKIAMELLNKHLKGRFLGPEAPPIPRLKNKYYQHIILKLPNDSNILCKAKLFLLSIKNQIQLTQNVRQVEVFFDVDTY